MTERDPFAPPDAPTELAADDAPRPRRGRARRRLLVELTADEEQAEELARRLAALDERVQVSPLDGPRQLPWRDLTFLALDTETTGLDPAEGRVMEVGWARVDSGRETEHAGWFCRVDEPLDETVAELTGITDAMLAGEPPFATRAPELLEALHSVDFVVAYNAGFDRAFLAKELTRAGHELPDLPWVDPLVFVRELDRYERGKKLLEASRRWGVPLDAPHRALADARAAGALLLELAPYLAPTTLASLLAQQARYAARQTRPPPPPDAPPS